MALRLGLVVLLAAFALPAQATTFVVREGDDSAPYSFLPQLARGAHPSLYALTGSAPAAHVFETWIRPDLPEALRGRGAQVADARLEVFYAFDDTSFGDGPAPPGALRLHRVLGPWDEATLTWAGRPAYGPVLEAHDDITGFGSLAFDVTALVRDWLDGTAPEYGIALTNPTARTLGMHSFEASGATELQPTLVIHTVPEAAGPVLLGLGVSALGTAARYRRRTARWTRPRAGLSPPGGCAPRA